MATKFVVYENCEIFFCFGIFKIKDYELVLSVLKRFDELMGFVAHYPSFKDFQAFQDMIHLYEEKKTVKEITQKSIFMKPNNSFLTVDEKLKNIFEAYNFCSKEKIIEMIQKSSEDDLNLRQSINKINKIALKANDRMKKQAHVVVFIMTKVYSSSDLFQKHLKQLEMSGKNAAFIEVEEPVIIASHQDFLSINISDIFENQKFQIFIDKLKQSFKIPCSKIRKQAYLSYFCDQELRINEIIRKVDEFDRLHLYDTSFSSNIDKSDVIVMFLTVEHLKSKKFEQELESAKRRKKIILPISLENINTTDLLKMNLIDFKTTVFQSGFRRFKIFFNRSLEIDTRDKFIKNQVSIKFISMMKKVTLLGKFDDFLVLNSDEIVYKQKQILRIKQIESGQTSCEIKLKNKNILLCSIDHLKKLFVLNKCFDDANAWGALYDLNGEISNSKIFLSFIYGEITSICYNKKNEKFYLFYNNFETSKHTLLIFNSEFHLISEIEIDIDGNRMSVSNDYIFITEYNSTKIIIYDLDGHYLTSFQVSAVIHSIYISLKYSNYVFIATNHDIRIFDSDSFSIVDIIEKPLELIAIYESKMIFVDSNDNLLFYEIEFFRNHTNVDSKYLCKLNPLKSHLFQNPCILPCGNSACMDCISNNYNLHKSSFKCNFASCQKEHQLTQQLEFDTNTNELMKGECDNILKVMIDESKEFIINNLGNILEEFDKRFSYYEEKIEIRIQSMYDELDELEDVALKSINLCEDRILKRKRNNKYEIKSNLKFLKTDFIGEFHNEYNNDTPNGILHKLSPEDILEDDDNDLSNEFTYSSDSDDSMQTN